MWEVLAHNSVGSTGEYAILANEWKLSQRGWDSATLRVGRPHAGGPYFTRGDPHPTLSGMYCVETQFEGPWRADYYMYSHSFLGLVGGANGMVMRHDSEGAHRTERNVTAADFYGGEAGYGSSDRPLFKLPGGWADALRFIELQPHSDREFVTSIPPPGSYSLDALRVGAKVLTVAPPTALDVATQMQRVANFPSGMLCSDFQIEPPVPGVAMWLATYRWEAVAQYTNT